jgi:hypothetical protein
MLFHIFVSTMANALCMYRIFCYTGHYLTPSLTPSWLMLQQVNHDPLENHTFPQMNGLANPYCMMLGCGAMASLAPISLLYWLIFILYCFCHLFLSCFLFRQIFHFLYSIICEDFQYVELLIPFCGLR